MTNRIRRLLVLLCITHVSLAFVVVRPSVARSSSWLFLAAEESSSNTESSIERLPNSAVELTLVAPGSATKAAYDKACAEVSKEVTIKGFRKGSKIPAQVLEQVLSGKEGGRFPLRKQAITALINELVEPALKNANLDPIGQPELVVPVETLVDSFKPGSELSMKIKCDVWPEIQWVESDNGKPYLGLTGSYKRKPFNQEKVDKALSDLKERYASLQPITDPDHALEMGDACVVNMVGYMAQEDGVTKGEPLPNAASGDHVEVVLGSGRYMEGLVEGLLGGKVGETKLIRVTFPEKLRDKTLAGKRAVFDVEILEASKRTVPELTDEFANQVRAGLTSEALLDELRKAVDEEDSKEFVGARNAALAKALATKLNVEIPDTLITNQAREKFAMMMTEMRDNGVSDEEIKKQINPENFEKYKNIVKDDIIRDFRVSMATDEIGRIENINVPDYQVEEQLESIRKDAEQEGQSDEFDETMVRGKVETTLLRNLVFDFLAENSNLEVIYEEEKFDEALLEKLAQESLEREQKLAAEKLAEEEENKGKNTSPPPTTNSQPAEVVTKPKEKKANKEDKYASLSLEEKAFQILVDTGGVQLNPDPEDPDYDSSKDDEIATTN